MRAIVVSTLAALGLLAAGCGSDTFEPGPGPGPCLPFGDPCGQPADCCSGVCVGGACLCNPAPGARCASSEECCPGQVCSGGACVQGCRGVGDGCDFAIDCCSGACNALGRCSATCSSGACAATADCCIGHYCALGFCSYGACGDLGDLCDDGSDCCQSPKHLTCSGSTCRCGTFASACATDADCCNLLVCSGGLCHPSPGTAGDGQSCLANLDCKSGTCAGAAPPSPGVCCTTAGGGCAVDGYGSLCCSPLTCNDAAATGTFECDTCLDWTNSGAPAPGVAACTRLSQCCSGQSLTCESATGRCARMYGVACGSAAECLTGADCSTRPGSSGNVCCAGFGSSCLAYGCCSGLECTQDQGGTGEYTCHVAPGGACQDDLDCASGDGCLFGTCCSHFGSCTSPEQCCSGICDQYGFCDWAPPYGQCLSDVDCLSAGYPNVCGGNPVLGPNVCCPAPGDVCAQGQATCCEPGNACQVPEYPPGSPALCCRALNAGCTVDEQCCSGRCYTYQQPSHCCAELGGSCAAPADCCGGWSGTTCGGAPLRCCIDAGFQAANGDPASCCSGQVQGQGPYCR